MNTHRLFSLAVPAVAAVSVIFAGASAMAAVQTTPSHVAHSNYRGPARPARTGRATALHGSNRLAPGSHPSALRSSAAQSSAASTPVKTVTHHYSLAASAFAPDGLHDTTEDYFNEWDPTTLVNQDTGRCFNAGLSLPPDITLKSVKAYYTVGSVTLEFQVNRQDLANHTGGTLVSFDSAIASTPVYTSTSANFPAADAVVNMTNYAYSAGVCFSGTTTFSGLTITYTQPAS